MVCGLSGECGFGFEISESGLGPTCRSRQGRTRDVLRLGAASFPGVPALPHDFDRSGKIVALKVGPSAAHEVNLIEGGVSRGDYGVTAGSANSERAISQRRLYEKSTHTNSSPPGAQLQFTQCTPANSAIRTARPTFLPVFTEKSST